MNLRTIVALILGLCLLVPPAPATQPKASANTETAWGLRTATFETSSGKVRVNLPDDLAAGDTISGTVIAEPAGSTDAERRANTDELSGYVVEVGKQRTPVRPESFSWSVPAALGGAVTQVLLRDAKGKPLATADVPVRSAQTATGPLVYQLPRIGQAGRPIEIRGPFDGAFGNTSCTVAGRPARKLAESPRQLIVETPSNLAGPVAIELREGQALAKGDCYLLRVSLTAPRTFITRGESILITARVEGLLGLPAELYPIPFQTAINTPEVVRFSDKPGALLAQSIRQAEVRDGTWSAQFPIVGIGPGSFRLTATAYYDALHDAKKRMTKDEFVAWLTALIGAWESEIARIDGEEKAANGAGKKWPGTAEEKGRQMRRRLLKEKKLELETAKDSAVILDTAKDMADKALADMSAIEIAVSLIDFAADLLGYKDIPLPALSTVFKGLKAMFKAEKIVKAIETAEQVADAYEKAKDLKEKAEKLKELKAKVDEVKKALGEK